MLNQRGTPAVRDPPPLLNLTQTDTRRFSPRGARLMYASSGSKWGTSPNLSLLLVCLCFVRRFVGDKDPFGPHGGRQMLMNNGSLILRSEVYHGSRERGMVLEGFSSAMKVKPWFYTGLGPWMGNSPTSFLPIFMDDHRGLHCCFPIY